MKTLVNSDATSYFADARLSVVGSVFLPLPRIDDILEKQALQQTGVVSPSIAMGY